MVARAGFCEKIFYSMVLMYFKNSELCQWLGLIYHFTLSDVDVFMILSIDLMVYIWRTAMLTPSKHPWKDRPMGSISNLRDRLRPVPPHIVTEEEALARCKSLIHSKTPLAQTMLVASGLLGASVPCDHGGADVSNAVMAEIVAELTQADHAIGAMLSDHYRVVDIIRSRASRDQGSFFMARALNGELFGLIGQQDFGNGARLVATYATGVNVSVDIPLASHQINTDWLLLNLADGTEQSQTILLSVQSPGLALVDSILIGADVTLGTDCLLATSSRDGSGLGDVIGFLLGAANELGIARRFATHIRTRFKEIDKPLASGSMGNLARRFGEVLTQMAAATALIERAGRKADMAQVNDTRAGDMNQGNQVENDLVELAIMSFIAAEATRVRCHALLRELDPHRAIDPDKSSPRIYQTEPVLNGHLLERIGWSAFTARDRN